MHHCPKVIRACVFIEGTESDTTNMDHHTYHDARGGLYQIVVPHGIRPGS